MADDSKVWAFLAVFLGIIGVVLAYVIKKDDKYVIHYAKQSLALFILCVIVWIVNFVLVWIPIIGWLIMWALWVVIMILWILGWAYALSGEKKEIPIVGVLANKF